MKEHSERARVLVVDDEQSMVELVADHLADRGFEAVAARDGRDALQRLEREPIDALVTDLRMPDVDGFALLAHSRRLDPARPVIIMTAFGAIDSAVEAIRQGAYHYLAKPFKLEELAIFLARAFDEVSVRREAASMRRMLGDREAPAGLVGRSSAMREVFDMIERVADADAPVLLTGETGTGKGRVAAALHARGRRASGPFVAVNCAALPENLLESELFGHARGAFSGATRARAGLFVEAHGGTLFLDEIAELAPGLQAKLLRVLDAGVVRPVGEDRERPVDVRVIAATHRDLRARVTGGAFREDLLYRLDVVSIELPPLRQRTEDIPALTGHFIADARARYPASPVRGLSPGAMRIFLEHRWPGNVRELSHAVERLVLLGRSEQIEERELSVVIRAVPTKSSATFEGEVVSLRETERRYAAWALERFGGVRSHTAAALDIDVKTLARLLAADGG